MDFGVIHPVSLCGSSLPLVSAHTPSLPLPPHRQRVLVLDEERVGHPAVVVVVNDGREVHRQQRQSVLLAHGTRRRRALLLHLLPQRRLGAQDHHGEAPQGPRGAGAAGAPAHTGQAAVAAPIARGSPGVLLDHCVMVMGLLLLLPGPASHQAEQAAPVDDDVKVAQHVGSVRPVWCACMGGGEGMKVGGVREYCFH